MIWQLVVITMYFLTLLGLALDAWNHDLVMVCMAIVANAYWGHRLTQFTQIESNRKENPSNGKD